MRLSPRSFPGDGVLDALVFTGPKSDAYRLLPRIFRHGDHVPDPDIQRAARADHARGSTPTAPARRRGRLESRHDAGHVPGGPSADPVEALTDDRRDARGTLPGWPREAAERAAAGRRSWRPSPDLAYLTGYEPMPLERPTLLVIRPDGDPVLLVPELERPLAADVRRPDSGRARAGDRLARRRRPVRAVSPDLLPRERSGGGRRPDLGLARLGAAGGCPALSFEPASPVIGRLRAREGSPTSWPRCAGPRPWRRRAFRRSVRERFLGRREEEVAADLAELLVEHGHGSRGLHDRRERAELRLAAP